MKKCARCQTEKSLDNFAKNKKRKDGLQTNCRECKKIIDASYYSENKEANAKRNKLKAEETKEWIKRYKSTLKCETCEENHPATLDFHHKDSSGKFRSIGDMITDRFSLASIKKEIDKCSVLCSNCHRKHHFGKYYNLEPTAY